MVFKGFVTETLFAVFPTIISPSLNDTIEGVVLPPSLFTITLGYPPSIKEIHEFVVPKSIPITFPICFLICLY